MNYVLIVQVIELVSIKLTVKALLMARQQAYMGMSSTRYGTSVNRSEPWRDPFIDHTLDKELARRKLALMFYLIRSPLFNRLVQTSYFKYFIAPCVIQFR